MATILGDDGVVLVGANAIAEITQFTLNQSAERIEDTVMGDANKTYKAGKADVNGQITCRYDSSDTNGQQSLSVGSQVSLVLRPQGTGSGRPEFTLDAFITEISIEVAEGAIVSRTFTYAAAGALAEATQA